MNVQHVTCDKLEYTLGMKLTSDAANNKAKIVKENNIELVTEFDFAFIGFPFRILKAALANRLQDVDRD